MARSASFKPRHHPDRSTSPWSIVIPPKLSDTGRKQERFFKTKDEALGEVQRLKVRKENHGTAAKLLSPADEQQAASALRLLKEAGVDVQLTVVVGEYLERRRQRNASKTLSHAWGVYLRELKEDGASDAHIKNHKRTMKRFASLHETLLSDLTAKDIAEVISGSSKSYYNAQLRELRSVLNYGIVKKWLLVNPVAEIGFKKRKLGEVEIYMPEQIETLMATTAARHPELVPAVALMTFAGIRPDYQDGEITKLDWSHVITGDKKKRIELPATVAKTAKRRTITIRPALASWLAWHRSMGGVTKGLVCPYKGEPLRKKLRAIHTEAKVDRIQDGFRHSFGSYLAKTATLDIAEQELGHQGGRELLNRHYRTDVRDVVAKRFWSLSAPKIDKHSRNKILQFQAA